MPPPPQRLLSRKQGLLSPQRANLPCTTCTTVVTLGLDLVLYAATTTTVLYACHTMYAICVLYAICVAARVAACVLYAICVS